MGTMANTTQHPWQDLPHHKTQGGVQVGLGAHSEHQCLIICHLSPQSQQGSFYRFLFSRKAPPSFLVRSFFNISSFHSFENMHLVPSVCWALGHRNGLKLTLATSLQSCKWHQGERPWSPRPALAQGGCLCGMPAYLGVDCFLFSCWVDISLPSRALEVLPCFSPGYK